MSQRGNAAPPGSRKEPNDLREAGTAMLRPIRRTYGTDRLDAPHSEQPPLKKSRPGELRLDAYGTDYYDRASPQHRASTWNSLRRQPASTKSYLDDAISGASSGHYYSWAAPRTSDETSSMLSRGGDCVINPPDADSYYRSKVTRSDPGHLSTSDDYSTRYAAHDSKSLIADGYFGDGHCDANSQAYATSIGQGDGGRSSKNGARCFDSCTGICYCSNPLMGQSLRSGCDNDSHITRAYPLSVYQNGVGDETTSKNQSWYPPSSEGNKLFQVRNFENTSSGINSETLCSSSNNAYSKTEDCSDQVAVWANSSVTSGSVAAYENSISYANSAHNLPLGVPLAPCTNDAPYSSVRSHTYVPNGLVLSSFGSNNVSAYGGNVPFSNGVAYTQLYPSCGPSYYFVANNLGTLKPTVYVAATDATNGQRSSHIACDAFYNTTTEKSTSNFNGHYVDGAVEKDPCSQVTAAYDSSRMITKEYSTSMFLTNASSEDSFERNCCDRSVPDFNEQIRAPVDEQFNNYQTGQCSGDMTYGTNGICETFPESSPHGAIGYREPKQPSASHQSIDLDVFKCPENALVHTTAPDFIPETIEQKIHFVQQTAGYHVDTQLSSDRLSDSNTFTCSNALIACNTPIFPGTAEQNANVFQDGAGNYDQAQRPTSNHMPYFELNSSSNEVFGSVTEFIPQKSEETLTTAQSTAVATAAAPVIVNGSGEISECDDNALCPGGAQQCGDNSGCALTAMASHITSAAKEITPESGSEQTDVPWEIGPQACPTGYAAELKSLITHAALAGAMPRPQKLKWPLPIPLIMKPRDKDITFHDMEYNWLCQCVYFVAQEEVHAQTLDEKGWLRIFVKSPRAAHNLVQAEALAGVLVKCTVVNSYTDSRGYVRNVPRRYSDTALFEMLQDEGVICAQRQTGFMRYENGAVGDMVTGTVLLTFLPDRRLPATVNIGLITYEVTRRLTLPMQCYNCQRFGHFARECTLPVSCRLCAGVHYYSQCTQRDKPHCVNCGEAHPSTYWRCPVRLAQASSEPRNLWLEDLVKV